MKAVVNGQAMTCASATWRDIRVISGRDPLPAATFDADANKPREIVGQNVESAVPKATRRRKAFCQGPCMLGDSFAPLCARCPRKKRFPAGRNRSFIIQNTI